MNAIRQWRIHKIDIRLAGLKAKLQALKELANETTTIPGGLVMNLRDLPQEIAELEERKRQLEARQ